MGIRSTTVFPRSVLFAQGRLKREKFESIGVKSQYSIIQHIKFQLTHLTP